jgi:uridine phosphorylase
METSALFTVSSCLRLKAGAVLLVIWNQERANKNLDNKQVFDTDKEIDVAIHAIEILCQKK